MGRKFLSTFVAFVFCFSAAVYAEPGVTPPAGEEPAAPATVSASRCPFAFLAGGIKGTFNFLTNRERLARLPRQLLRRTPFAGGDILPARVPILSFFSGRPSLPVPTPWNYTEPLKILATYFWGADKTDGPGRHNRYLEVPGFPPVLVTRDPKVIKAILMQTGNKEGEFDRAQLPSEGIARSTGRDSVLFLNGDAWYKQRKAIAPAFGKTGLWDLHNFQEFETTARQTLANRVEKLKAHLAETGQDSIKIKLEDELKPLMLEMLVNNFFGAEIPYEEIRNKYVPALERIIAHLVKDTVVNKVGLSKLYPRSEADYAIYEELTDIVLAARTQGKGHWKYFKSDLDNDSELVRTNVRVFLAGALEATASYAGWALTHVSGSPPAQEKLYQEIKNVHSYTPETLDDAGYLRDVMDETLRKTPSLYFLPRQAPTDIALETDDNRKMNIPKGTMILLDVWDSNNHPDFWGVEKTGFPENEFHPERWAAMAAKTPGLKRNQLHFGFGAGKRVCPGQHLGQLETALAISAMIKAFEIKAINPVAEARAGVSTKPKDGTYVELRLRNPNAKIPTTPGTAPETPETP